MRMLYLILSLGSSLISVHCLVHRTPSEQSKDAKTIATFANQGLCINYLDKKSQNRDKSLASCKIWCEKKHPDGVSSYACSGALAEGAKYDSGSITNDEDGNKYVPGECLCEIKILEDIVNTVIAILPMIDNLLCAGFLQTFQIIADTATIFIPGGGQALRATKVAVDVVKTLAENDLGSDAFGNWIGKTCDFKGGNFEYWSVFDVLLEAPDSVGMSLGCKKKKGCKPTTAKPDPPAEKPKDVPASIAPPQPTKTDILPVLTAPALSTVDSAAPTLSTADSAAVPTNTLATPPATPEQSLPTTSELNPQSTMSSITSEQEHLTSTDQQSLSNSDTQLTGTTQSGDTKSESSLSTTLTHTDSKSDITTISTSTIYSESSTDSDDEETESETEDMHSTTSSSALVCRLNKRAPAKAPKGKLGTD